MVINCPALALMRLAVILPFCPPGTLIVYEPVVPSSPAKSNGPSAAEHETIAVIAAMTAAAAIAAPKCFVFRIMSFLRLFTGLKYSIYMIHKFGIYFNRRP
jgi:hypothetical protein